MHARREREQKQRDAARDDMRHSMRHAATHGARCTYDGSRARALRRPALTHHSHSQGKAVQVRAPGPAECGATLNAYEDIQTHKWGTAKAKVSCYLHMHSTTQHMNTCLKTLVHTRCTQHSPSGRLATSAQPGSGAPRHTQRKRAGQAVGVRAGRVMGTGRRCPAIGKRGRRTYPLGKLRGTRAPVGTR